MTMTLVSTVTVGAGGAASIDFTSIPQTGTDLILALNLRENFAANDLPLRMRINGVSSDSYTDRALNGNGGSVTSYSNQSSGMGFFQLNGMSLGTTFTANTFSNTQIYFPNYTTGGDKFIAVESSTENNAATARNIILTGKCAGAGAVSSLSLFCNATWLQYSTASLYTITKGSGGATVA